MPAPALRRRSARATASAQRRGGWRGTLAAPVALLALAGCSPPSDAGGPRADLLAPLNAPTLLRERARTGAAEPVFLDGWSVVERAPAGPSLRWLGAEPGRLLLDLVDPEPRPRRLELELRAARLPDRQSVGVEVLLDGERLDAFDCSPAWQRYRLEIPARLAGPGPHLLELRPASSRLTRARGGGGRRISIALRELRLEPAAAGEPARLADGALHLPPGTAAAWTFWAPPGGRLIASWEAGSRGGAGLLVADEDSPPRALGEGALDALAGRCLRLLALNPPAAAASATLTGLLLARPAAAPAAPRPAARSALVIGALDEGFPITPSTTAPGRARAALLSGREAAALGWPLPAAFDLVTADPAAAAAFLATAPPPAAVALDLAGAPARPVSEELAARFPDLRVLMAELPSGDDDLSSLAATLGPSRAPENARDLDLTVTTLAAAGHRPAGLDGVDLGPVLAGEAPARVRPVAPVWQADRAVAVTGDRRWVLVDGDARRAASLAEACALDYLRRRRRGLAWLEN